MDDRLSQLEHLPEVSLVIPIFNERSSLEHLFQRLQKFGDYEVILVDDGSCDDSWTMIQHCAGRFTRFHAIRFTRNFGKEAAIRAGLRAASGRAVVVMDGDLQHPPEAIPVLVQQWRAGFPIVEAIVAEKQRVGLRGVLSKIFLACCRTLTGIDFSKSLDFKVLDRGVVEQLNKLPERTSFFRGNTNWLGYPTCSVPIVLSERVKGSTRWSLWRLFCYAMDILTLTSTVPLRMVSAASGILFLFATLLSVQSILNWARGNALEGFTTVIICILFVGSILSLSLGIIGEYLARIYSEIRGKPEYIIKESF